MPAPSESHLVLIPTYNTGEKVSIQVRNALETWNPVWVVVDGSDDGSGEDLEAMAENVRGLRVIRFPENMGKGAAIFEGICAAEKEGFSHVLTMDADGQHPVESVVEFMHESEANPGALILGKPVFDESAPALRVNGRRVSNFWANLETLWAGIDDSLFGLRVYPVADLRAVMKKTRWARRFDFDPEVAVRLIWRGMEPVNLAAPVRYLTSEEGGVSQFRYVRDNTLLTWMHVRLFGGFLIRLPLLIWRLIRGRNRPRCSEPPSD